MNIKIAKYDMKGGSTITYIFQSPIKMPRGSHYGSDFWITYSYKLKRRVNLYSYLEYTQFISLEMNPEVEFFCEQPLEISGTFNGKNKKSVFDFWVQYKNSNSEFQEVKYISELKGNDKKSVRSKEQTEFQKQWCDENNYKYAIITDEDIFKSRHYIGNLQLLRSHLIRSGIINKKDGEELLKKLRFANLTIGEIRNLNLVSEDNLLGILAKLLYDGIIEIDAISRPLDKSTEVHLCG
ncbi:MAG: Tn7 transposase TnsA N-terminal domain-containing protein [Parabacteroides sp.]|nr:Tn7 transposase TnsA N-terminal domain-containing protein [Parabacteroides sp.]